MSFWILLKSPPLVLSSALENRLRTVLDQLPIKAVLSINKIANLDGVPTPYDHWSTNPRWVQDSEAENVLPGPSGLDFSRPDPVYRNRFRRHAGGKYEALFYDGRILVAQVIVEVQVLSPGALQVLAQEMIQILSGENRPIFSSAFMVVSQSGAVYGYDNTAAVWLSSEVRAGELVKRLIGAPDRAPAMLLYRDALLKCRPLAGTAGLHLIRIDPVEPVRLAPDAALTPAQRRVAAYAAVGATVDEIARAVSSRRETVRTHLKEVYRRLDVASRLELARALQT